MKLPNLLATRGGRLSAFFFLYLTEGLPLGFAATAIATQMRRQGVGPAEIGAFVGTLYLPWAFKWAMGPLVDVITSERFGRRRTWIVFTQAMMVMMMMVALPIDFTAELKLYTFVILIFNFFGATQDVAIDALACNVLSEKERGVANGLMFGGAYLGQALGGAGVLFLIPHIGLSGSYVFVAAVLLAVLLFIALPIKEPKDEARAVAQGPLLARVFGEIMQFVREVFRAFSSSRAAWIGLVFALLPGGAYALSLALQSNLAVELGLQDSDIAKLALASTVISAVCCVIGGWLSDRFGRRKMLALFYVGTVIPGFALAWFMWRQGWIMPIDPQMPDRPVPAAALVTMFWAACLTFSVFQGLMYGTRSALFMDITTPAVAATQFTAYMALCNLVITYSATWQGFAIERWGYPITLTVDGVAGLLCLGLLPFMSLQTKGKADGVGLQS
ncbi:MAG: MFS transporter [Cephaloticoccus sp.]|nr:MFS transporter [Cephaloticoccus sp.]